MTRSIKEQLRRNTVALISLTVAITSLGYNTWRNEHSEFNRNQRQASFEVLLKIGELEELVFHSVYDPGFANAGNARTGWALVLTIRDLSHVIDGTANIRDINKALGWQLPTDGPKTLNGVILEHLESFPDGPACLHIDSVRMEILEVRDNLITAARCWQQVRRAPRRA